MLYIYIYIIYKIYYIYYIYYIIIYLCYYCYYIYIYIYIYHKYPCWIICLEYIVVVEIVITFFTRREPKICSAK